MWRAPLALFLLSRELFSDPELFTDRELRDAHTPLIPMITQGLVIPLQT